MMTPPARARGRGPFTADQLPEGPYELSEGHPIYCEPAGGQHGSANLTGSLPLATDPDVDEAGVDTGFVGPSPDTVRAPDVAVGNVPMKSGWVQGAPPLAVEYADTGTDEADLQKKIGELLAAGTRFIWVVRLIGLRRVEVYESGKPVRTLGVGEELLAPGILRNPVPVEALFDRRAALETTFRNLLHRKGYADLEAVREEGRAEGAKQALIGAIEALCDVLAIPLDDDRRDVLVSLDANELQTKLEHLRQQRSW